MLGICSGGATIAAAGASRKSEIWYSKFRRDYQSTDSSTKSTPFTVPGAANAG
jgi:hypothetical protein